MFFYSPSTGGFYTESVHGARVLVVPDSEWVPVEGEEAPFIELPNPDCHIPADAVEVSRERHAELMAAQTTGLEIAPGDGGLPVARERIVPHAARVAAVMATTRAWRELVFKPLDILRLDALTDSNATLATQCKTAAVGLRNLPEVVEPLLTDSLTVRQMEQVAVAEYKKLVKAQPAAVREAFKELAAALEQQA